MLALQWCDRTPMAKRPRPTDSSDCHSSDTKGVFFSRSHGAWLARTRIGQKSFSVAQNDAGGALLPAETYKALMVAQRTAAENGSSRLRNQRTTVTHLMGVSQSYSSSDGGVSPLERPKAGDIAPLEQPTAGGVAPQDATSVGGEPRSDTDSEDAADASGFCDAHAEDSF